MLTWVLGISSTQRGGVTWRSRESCDQGSLYLHEPSGSFNILLVLWVAWFCPVRVYGDGDEPSLPGPEGLVVEVPDLRVCLDQVVPHHVGSAPWPDRDACRDRDSTGRAAAPPNPSMAVPRLTQPQGTQNCPWERSECATPGAPSPALGWNQC